MQGEDETLGKTKKTCPEDMGKKSTEILFQKIKEQTPLKKCEMLLRDW